MVNIEKKIEEIKNKTGLMLALLFMLLIGAGPAVARTEPGDKKEKAPTEKKKNKLAAVKKNKKVLTTYYFQYSGTNSEAAYENAGNWIYLSDTQPESDPCPGANNIVCVLKADFETTPTTADLAAYLSGLSTGATAYCTNSTNISYRKP